MLSTSYEFRKKASQSSKMRVKATLTLADGTVRNLDGDDFMMGSASFDSSVSSLGSFDVGAAVIGKFGVTLNNYDGRFDEYDFTGATLVTYVGVELDAGGVEWLLKGYYGVEQPETYGGTIGLTALDNMRKLERPYSDVSTTYPATLGEIVYDICTTCGVTLVSSAFANYSYSVSKRPVGNYTCIQVLSFAAQASGNYARCRADGKLAVEWYNTAAFEGEDWLDGEWFDDADPYASGDTADGGGFMDGGDEVEGGSFDFRPFDVISALSSISVSTDDVVVTGVRVTAQDQVDQDGTAGNDGETYLYGNDGYVLSLPDNPLILYGKAQAVATQVGARVVGMRFRPFDVSCVGNPALEAGDPVIIVDRLQNQYRSYVTSLTYKVNNYAAVSCGAETPSRNSAASYSALTEAVVKARNSVKLEKTAREQAVAELAQELANSSGLFMTAVEQQDHSYIYYMHDKPTLAQSQIVWKLTANAFGISTDGGTTYPYGIDVTGTAILNRIYAVGINADYITTGSLSVKNGNTEVFKADVSSGTVAINTTNFKLTTSGVITATSGTIGGFTISSSSIYNNTPTISSTAAGVYVGTDGVMTSDGTERIVVANGDILGYKGSTKVGTISPTAEIEERDASGNLTGTVWRGLHLLGDAMIIATPHLAVINQNSATAEAQHTVTTSHTLGSFSSFTSSSDQVSITPATVALQYTCGMLVSSGVTTSTAVTMPTKTYVDTQLATKASSTHTHAYSSLTGLPTLPSFSLSGNTLYITT